MRKLLFKIESIPYNQLVGVIYDSGVVINGLFYDTTFKDWQKKNTNHNGKPIKWFVLDDFYKSKIMKNCKHKYKKLAVEELGKIPVYSIYNGFLGRYTGKKYQIYICTKCGKKKKELLQKEK